MGETWKERMERVQRKPGYVKIPAAPKAKAVASECDLYGHDYQVRETTLPERLPYMVACSRCPLRWDVDPKSWKVGR